MGFRFPFENMYSIHIYTENGTNGNGNFRLFDANGNGKRKFVLLGRPTINGNLRLLFQQTCPSMLFTDMRTSRTLICLILPTAAGLFELKSFKDL
jgi:hypothetical protein